MTPRENLCEIANKLFIYTDNQDWEKLKSEVFADDVLFDMTSLGGDVGMKTAQQICDEWAAGFEGIDSINHLAGNYLVRIDGGEAAVFAYATATHYKESAQNGKTREFVGTYDLHFIEQQVGQ